MAKMEKILHGNFDDLLKQITDGILEGSVSASLEDGSDFRSEESRCSVRVFERYSYSGSNRLSLNLTLFQCGEEIRLSAITSGGSTGMFVKINRIGENAFLDKLKKITDHMQ